MCKRLIACLLAFFITGCHTISVKPEEHLTYQGMPAKAENKARLVLYRPKKTDPQSFTHCQELTINGNDKACLMPENFTYVDVETGTYDIRVHYADDSSSDTLTLDVVSPDEYFVRLSHVIEKEKASVGSSILTMGAIVAIAAAGPIVAGTVSGSMEAEMKRARERCDAGEMRKYYGDLRLEAVPAETAVDEFKYLVFRGSNEPYPSKCKGARNRGAKSDKDQMYKQTAGRSEALRNCLHKISYTTFESIESACTRVSETRGEDTVASEP